MTLGERCEEILRLIDAVLDPTPAPAVTHRQRRGRQEPVLAVVPVSTTTRRSPHPQLPKER